MMTDFVATPYATTPPTKLPNLNGPTAIGRAQSDTSGISGGFPPRSRSERFSTPATLSDLQRIQSQPILIELRPELRDKVTTPIMRRGPVSKHQVLDGCAGIHDLQDKLFPREWEMMEEKEPETSPLAFKPLLSRVYSNADVGTVSENLYKFTIMNFNVLADGLSGFYSQDSSKLFIRVPHNILDWKFRGPLIVAEIMRWEPDVVTMQECDQFEYLKEELYRYGYDAQFQPKLWSPNWKLYKGDKPFDGVAVFYKRDKFLLVKSSYTSQRKHVQRVVEALYDVYIDYFENEVNEIMKEECGMWISPEKHTTIGYALAHNHLPNFFSEHGFFHLENLARMLKRDDSERIIEFVREDLGGETIVPKERFIKWIQDNPTPVSISVRLRPLGLGEHIEKDFVICSTHLHSGKDLDGEFRRRRELVALLNDPEVVDMFDLDAVYPFIGCDLNAAPLPTKGYPPLAYRYMVGSGVPGDETYDRSDPVPCVPGAYKSACRTEKGELPFSTWKHRVKNGEVVEDKHTIDYIFFPPGGPFTVRRILGMPTDEEVQRERQRLAEEQGISELPSALPCSKYPSDHFAVMAEFVYKKEEKFTYERSESELDGFTPQ